MITPKKYAPIFEPINVRRYEFTQSDYEMADQLPFRSFVVSASQGGKGILIQNLVLKEYRGCFERIYIVSPTAHIDEAYREVIKYIEKDLEVENKKEQSLFEEIDAPSLEKIKDTQHKVIEYQKNFSVAYSLLTTLLKTKPMWDTKKIYMDYIQNQDTSDYQWWQQHRSTTRWLL